MDSREILFEKLVIYSDVETDCLIKCSEKRRSLYESIQSDSDIYDAAKGYYEIFVSILPCMESAKVKSQPYFEWYNNGSSCWLYEKIHLEDLLMKESWKLGLRTTDLKKKRYYFKYCINYGCKALDTLNNYHWEDLSILNMPTMQDRYYLYNICKGASQHFKTMNLYAKQQGTSANSKCIELAFQFMDSATCIWKYDQYDIAETNNLKAQYLLDMAQKRLTDDQCGERCALLQDVIECNNTPKYVKAQYNVWKQQNENVYFKKEETTMDITFFPLKDLFQSLKDIVEKNKVVF